MTEALLLGMNLNQWFIIILIAFLVGFSKTGISGVMMLAIPILATAFGGRDSTGIMLPMLVVGDIFAIRYYHRSADLKSVITPLPWAMAGLVAGVIVGNYISDNAFMKLIGIIVLLCLGILIYTEVKGQNFKVPNAPWFYIAVGVLSGFASMIGNAAGPIFSIYLLALGLKKNNYMGISAWFFFVINLSKVPLQVFVWHNIDLRTLTIAAVMIPVIAIGAVLGALILKKINERVFRYLVIGMTSIAAVRLLL